MAESVGAAWQRVADEVVVSLPGPWVRRRSGAKAMLVREPIEWTLARVSFRRRPASDEGYIYAAVIPLTEPFVWTVTYGSQMGDHPRPPGVPGALPVLEPGAADMLRRFLTEQALPEMDRWPAERLAEVAERSYALPAEERAEFSPHWLQVAGWRVVNDTDSPVEPAREAVDFLRGHYGEPEHVQWYEQLAASWESGGRAAALQYLVDQRQQVLVREKLLG